MIARFMFTEFQKGVTFFFFAKTSKMKRPNMFKICLNIVLQINLECNSNHPIEDVMVAIDTSYPIVCNKPSCVIPSIGKVPQNS